MKLNLDLELVKRDYRNLRYVEKQTPEIVKTAIKNNWRAIEFINKELLTKEVTMKCAKQPNNKILKYIDNPSDELIYTALKYGEKNIKYIKNPTKQMRMLALKKKISYFRFLENPTEEEILYVVRRSLHDFKYISKEKQTEEIINAVIFNITSRESYPKHQGYYTLGLIDNKFLKKDENGLYYHPRLKEKKIILDDDNSFILIYNDGFCKETAYDLYINGKQKSFTMRSQKKLLIRMYKQNRKSIVKNNKPLKYYDEAVEIINKLFQ